MSGDIQGHGIQDFHNRGNKINSSKSGFTRDEGGNRIFGPDGVQIGVIITTHENGQEVQTIFAFSHLEP